MGASARQGTRQRHRRWILLVSAAGVLAAALLVCERGVQDRRAVRSAFPRTAGRIEVEGLSASLTILRDERGIPHIRAENPRDAYFGLGFAHAQDRLAQMIWLLRAARGRTAEILGPEALPADRLARTLGFGRLAAREAERLDRATQRKLEAYAAGVSARIERVRAGRVASPLPLARLEVPLETWTVADSLAVSKLFSWGLEGSLDVTLVLWDLIERLGGFDARLFFPSGAAGSLVPLPEGHPVQARAPWPRAVGALGRSVALAGGSVGSSAWVVAGTHSESGAPLLAADMHLEPTVPPLLYQAHLEAPELNVVGVTLPGVPVFWSGHNGRVAWGSTHGRAVVVDLYKETLNPDAPRQYRGESRWEQITEREERIVVRGGAAELLAVRATHHGPLIHELVGPERGPLSLAWSGAQPGNGVGALLRAASASDAGDFRAALAEHHDPVLAIVYADAEGQGGLQVAGWLPKRAMTTNLVPVPGRTRWYNWRGRLPFEQLPHVALGPDVGWLIAADNPLGDPEAPFAIEWLWTKRVRLALEIAGPPAELPLEAAELSRILRAWDGEAAASSIGAAAYNLLVVHLLREILAEPLGEDLLERYAGLRGVSPEAVLGQLLEAAFDPQGAAGRLADARSVRRAVRSSLRHAGLALLVKIGTNRDKWTWGRLHRLRFRSFGWPELAWEGSWGWQDPPHTSVAYGGDGVTVAVGEYAFAEPFQVRVASLYRIVLDVGDPHVALSALAPGPSEHPGHPHRSVELERWLAGELGLLASQRILVEELARESLHLEPRS
jgi:penicillin amidase